MTRARADRAFVVACGPQSSGLLGSATPAGAARATCAHVDASIVMLGRSPTHSRRSGRGRHPAMILFPRR